VPGARVPSDRLLGCGCQGARCAHQAPGTSHLAPCHPGTLAPRHRVALDTASSNSYVDPHYG
jgi:hypothetical protein